MCAVFSSKQRAWFTFHLDKLLLYVFLQLHYINVTMFPVLGCYYDDYHVIIADRNNGPIFNKLELCFNKLLKLVVHVGKGISKENQTMSDTTWLLFLLF